MDNQTINQDEILFDMELENGEKLEGIYFIQYEQEIKSGHGFVLGHAPSHMNAFYADGTQIEGVDISSAKIIRAYDPVTNADLTDVYKMFSGSILSLGKNPYIRRTELI